MSSNKKTRSRRADRKRRRAAYLTPKINSFLIITEGTSTEPNYFVGIQKLITESIGGVVDVVEIPNVEIRGTGRSTMKLLEEAESIIKKSKVIYQNVWIVFDKDDFDDFDLAIREGEKKGYSIAWSNQSFEYWLYLHFYYSDAALHRHDWEEKLNQLFKKNAIGNGKYEKNDEELFAKVQSTKGATTAIKHAKLRMRSFNANNMKPSEYDPGTTVYALVEQLLSYIS